MSDPADGHAWDGERVRRWLASADRLEGQLAPVADALFEVADLRAGERVVDVGCGHGPTTRTAAALVGVEGSVVGLDVSSEMLDAAGGMPVEPGSAPIDWVVADATHWEGPDAPVDVAISRFGVMFFDDPTQAFANLARTTRPGGRLVVAVWAHRHLNPLFEIPLEAALAVRSGLGLPPVDVPRPDAGPFSLADVDHVRELLGRTGWTDVAVDRRHLRLPLAGGLPLDEAAASTLEVGPTRVLTADMEATARAAVVAAVAEELLPHLEGGSVLLDAEIHVVSATRP